MSDDAAIEVTVPVEPMTPESFAPYGTVFGTRRATSGRSEADTGFWHRGQATLGTIWNPPGGHVFSQLERHFGVTQAFVQLAGAAAVVCVAPATDPDDREALPAPESVRGFLIDPGHGYQFHRGTWHALDRCVLAAPGAMFLIVNSSPNPTQIADFTNACNWLHADLGGRAAPEALAWPGTAPCRFRVDA